MNSSASATEKITHPKRFIHHLPKDDFRLRAINRFALKKLPPRNITLDWGAGAGYLIDEMLARDPAARIDGCDISPHLLTFLNEKFQKNSSITIIDGNVKTLEPKRHSTIYSLDVIEHTENDVEQLANLYRSLAPGGKAFINIPAHQRFFTKFDRDLGHFRRYSKSDARNKFERVGFIIDDIGYWNTLGYFAVRLSRTFPFLKRPQSVCAQRTFTQRIVNTILSGWFLAIENTIPSPIGLSIYVVARKPMTDMKNKYATHETNTESGR